MKKKQNQKEIEKVQDLAHKILNLLEQEKATYKEGAEACTCVVAMLKKVVK